MWLYVWLIGFHDHQQQHKPIKQFWSQAPYHYNLLLHYPKFKFKSPITLLIVSCWLKHPSLTQCLPCLDLLSKISSWILVKLTAGKALLYLQGGSQLILVCLTCAFRFWVWVPVLFGNWGQFVWWFASSSLLLSVFPFCGIVTVTWFSCLRLFQVHWILKVDWFSDVRGEISVSEKGRICAIQSKTWSPSVAAASSTIQTSRCVLLLF